MSFVLFSGPKRDTTRGNILKSSVLFTRHPMRSTLTGNNEVDEGAETGPNQEVRCYKLKLKDKGG